MRHGSGASQTIEPTPLIQESVDLFVEGTNPRREGEVESHARTDLPLVRVDAGRLIQILLALLGNAHEAILGTQTGGQLRLALNARPPREPTG